VPLKLAIVVHGRFHAFDLARELLRQGAEVTLLTNYPKRVAQKFGVADSRVRNCLWHGLANRFVHRAMRTPGRDLLEPCLHRWFSRWAAQSLRGMELDAIHSFSGVSEELLRAFQCGTPLRSLVRGSAHIRTQARLLSEEEQRCGRRLHRPGSWIVARELREYELADLVIVLSSFAAKSFLDEGFPEEKLRILPLGSDLSRFRPTEELVQERCRRISAGRPLRVLTVGSFSYQKGMYDLVQIVERLHGRLEFRFVGDCPPETRKLRSRCCDKIHFVPRQPQLALARQYHEGDVFLFPTIQDGYAVVLAQALAAGLPVLTTTNCAGPDLIREGQTGWVLPIRNSDAFIERLIWCHAHREYLARMVCNAFAKFQPPDWAQVAGDLMAIYDEIIPTFRPERMNRRQRDENLAFSTAADS